MRRARRVAGGAADAITFLTVLPLHRHAPGELGAAAPWFPVVGALVGALAGGVLAAGEPLVGVQVAAMLAVVVLVAVTGALHVDGLADCADALGARGGRERRLAVMRDPAVGVFGTLALLGWALLVIGSLARLGPDDGLRALVCAAAVGRWSALLHAIATPPARREGLGAGFTVTPAALAVATLATAALALLFGGLAALLAGAIVAALVSLWARRTLGGRTGDTLGTTVALAEVVACLSLAATIAG